MNLKDDLITEMINENEKNIINALLRLKTLAIITHADKKYDFLSKIGIAYRHIDDTLESVIIDSAHLC